MVLDFTKGKYGLQLISLLFVVLISGLIFQLIGGFVVGMISSLDLFSTSGTDIYKVITKEKNGFWILSILLFFNSIGLFLIPGLIFSRLIASKASKYLSINFKSALNFIPLLPLFILSGVFIVGYLGELNMKIDLPEMFHKMESEANEIVSYITSFRSSMHVITTIIILAVIPAIGEELIFRGIIQKILIQWTEKKWIGILITAFVFSAMHLQFLTFLPRFFMGIVLGYLFVWSKNLLIPMIAHFLHNLISIIIGLVFTAKALNTPESTDLGMVSIATLVLFVIGYRYYLLSKKRHV